MASSKWEKVEINTSQGMASGVAPIIISASRATDIPAFYGDWFMKRLEAGYIKWVNPFNGTSQYVSFANTRVVVFWSKDPKPLLTYLKRIDEKDIHYYFNFTLNDYDADGLEPNLRKLEQRIDTFKQLSSQIGRHKVIWRFDPLILTEKISVEVLLDRLYRLGNQVAPYTEKLVISFADISTYRKVQSNLNKADVKYKEFTEDSMLQLAKGLSEINRAWELKIATCAESIDLSPYHIQNNRCIDEELMIRHFSEDKRLMDFLGYEDQATLMHFVEGQQDSKRIHRLRDSGQREHCGCIISKDIGQYNTCDHQCLYCYANSSPQLAHKNYMNYLKSSGNKDVIIE